MKNVQSRVEGGSDAGQQYSLAVAVANPANVEQLMRTTSSSSSVRPGSADSGNGSSGRSRR